MAKQTQKPGTVGKAGDVQAPPAVRPQARMLEPDGIQAAKAARANLTPEEQKKLDDRLLSKMRYSPIDVGSPASPENVLKLILAGADVNARTAYGETALMVAVHSFAMDPIVELLIEHGAEVDARDGGGKTALMQVPDKITWMDFGYSYTAELLIAKGADVNAKDHEGHSVLWHAVGSYGSDGRQMLVEVLKAAGATE